jgi:hypothetical protein
MLKASVCLWTYMAGTNRTRWRKQNTPKSKIRLYSR